MKKIEAIIKPFKLDDVKEALKDNLISAMQDPTKFTKMGIKPPKGALIYGPPGCGKTLIARALATESGANMILVKGPELLSKWVGESEKGIREIFRKAKASSPCVVIFDELDSLVRSKTGEGGVSETVLSQLLTEIEEGISRQRRRQNRHGPPFRTHGASRSQRTRSRSRGRRGASGSRKTRNCDNFDCGVAYRRSSSD